MPYRRSYRRSYRPRRRYRRRYRSSYSKPTRYRVADAAYKGYKLARRLWDAVNVEYKSHDISQAATNIDYNGHTLDLNTIGQGDTDHTRDGSSVKNQTLYLNINAIAHATQASTARFILVWDKQNQLTIADYFADTGTALAPITFKERDTRFRFKTLWDSGPITLITGSDHERKAFKKTIPLNRHTQFEGSTDAIESGRLVLLAISDRASDTPYYYCRTRLTYTDN